MKFAAIATLLVSANAVLLQKHHHHPNTGDIIPICNGANSGNCTEANEVVKHKVRRPHKRATEGAPDWEDQVAADKARMGGKSLAQRQAYDPSTGEVIPVCNGANDGNCMEPKEINTHKIRRAHKRAAKGDPDFADQEAADKVATGKSLAQEQTFDPSTGAILPVCNGANTGNCHEPEAINTHKIRRAHKRAAEGDADFADQEAADKKAMGKSLA
jgi:hypothetical protein